MRTNRKKSRRLSSSPQKKCVSQGVSVMALLALQLYWGFNLMVSEPNGNDTKLVDAPSSPVKSIPTPTGDEAKEIALESKEEEIHFFHKINDIFWLHIQKTGTSLFNTIYLHFCPRILDTDPSLATQKDPLGDVKLLRNYPPREFCNVTFANMPCPGCHHAYPKDKKIGEKYFYFTMLRDPMERLKSAYSFGKHLSKLQDDSISFDTYLNESHIPNCQLKMILGFRCDAVVDPHHLNISVALDRIQAPHFFFGITDRWEESICLFHRKYGGSTQAFELKNNRKTKRKRVESGNINRTFAETVFFEEAFKLFDMRVKKAGC